MLRSLQGQAHTCQFAKLPCPHTGAVNNKLGFHRAVIRYHRRHLPLLLEHISNANPFNKGSTPLPKPLGQRHGDIYRVSATVFCGIERAYHVIPPRVRPMTASLFKANFVTINAEIAHERRGPAHLLEAFGIASNLEVANRFKTCGKPRLFLEC